MLNVEKKTALTALLLWIFLWSIAFLLYNGFQGADGSGYIIYSRDVYHGIKQIFQSHRFIHLLCVSIFPYKFVNIYSLLFSILFILIFFTIRKKIGLENNFLSYIALFSTPIFLVFSPLVYTEIPSLTLSLLGLYLAMEKKYLKAGVIFAISLFFKETALFMLIAVGLYLLLRKDMKSLFVLSLSFLLIFLPLVFSFYIFTGKIWLLSFLKSSEMTYSKFFSLWYDYIFRRIVFLSLLGLFSVFGLINMFNMLQKRNKYAITVLFYSLFMLLVYFSFHAVSPRFSAFFLPVLLFVEFKNSKLWKSLLILVAIIQISISLFSIHIFSIPFSIEKDAKDFIVNHYDKKSIDGFSFSISYELEKKGFIRSENPDILFIEYDKVPKNYTVVKEFNIPCTMKLFRMLKCKDTIKVIALKKTLISKE